jgi:hypothetical protein
MEEKDMRRGSLPRSIGRALPAPVGYDFAPDGLDEAAIDALIAAVDTEVTSSRPCPGWLSTDQVETRRVRRAARQAFRGLSANVLVGGVPGQGKSNAAQAVMAELEIRTFDPETGEAA